MLKSFATLLLLTITFAQCVTAEPIKEFEHDWTLTLAPDSGQISRPSGSEIGWGFSVENYSPSLWLLLGAAYVEDPIEYADWNDLLLLGFPVISPSSTSTAQYDGTRGLAAIRWQAVHQTLNLFPPLKT